MRPHTHHVHMFSPYKMMINRLSFVFTSASHFSLLVYMYSLYSLHWHTMFQWPFYLRYVNSTQFIELISRIHTHTHSYTEHFYASHLQLQQSGKLRGFSPTLALDDSLWQDNASMLSTISNRAHGRAPKLWTLLMVNCISEAFGWSGKWRAAPKWALSSIQLFVWWLRTARNI